MKQLRITCNFTMISGLQYGNSIKTTISMQDGASPYIIDAGESHYKVVLLESKKKL